MMAIIWSRYQYGPFLFFVATVMSNYLTTDGLKKISLLPEAPLWPEACGICHICHISAFITGCVKCEQKVLKAETVLKIRPSVERNEIGIGLS